MLLSNFEIFTQVSHVFDMHISNLRAANQQPSTNTKTKLDLTKLNMRLVTSPTLVDCKFSNYIKICNSVIIHFNRKGRQNRAI